MGDLFSAASKLGVASIYRIGLSGLIAVLLILPLQNALVPDMLKVDELTDFITIVIPQALILGLFITSFRSVIYRIYEGRLLWPARLHDSMTNRIERKVQKRLSETKKLKQTSARYRELWYWLRLFPLDEKGDPTAARPTLLGNVLEGYETYPDRRYGMDSVFYWYRLWPTLPESFINQADMASARADMLMFASGSSFLSGLAFVILGAAKILNETMPDARAISFSGAFPSAMTLFTLGILYLLLFYLFYRASIPLHRSNGEFYKAAFDLYRNNIKSITEISEDDKVTWQKTWTYLQYMYVQCKYCKKYFFAEEENCPYCHRRRRPG
jgi:hypothetical protein